jgi:FdhD protein
MRSDQRGSNFGDWHWPGSAALCAHRLKKNTRKLWRWRHGQRAYSDRDELAREEPLEIQVETKPICVTMRTPGHDEELAAGFLLSEALVTSPNQIKKIKPYPRNPGGNVVHVFLEPDVPMDLARLSRHVYASSSCGLCGKTTIDAVHQHFKPVRTKLKIKGSLLLSLPEKMIRSQAVFGRTGGLHAAAVFTTDGELVVAREDVGRHNAVDKVLGYGLLQNLLPFRRHILMVSGRASFEIMQKALAAGIPVVAALSAPSSLAVEFGAESGQTLVAFLRGDKLNVYTGRSRLDLGGD